MEIQLPDGWCRQDEPASVLLQCGSCWEEVVEVQLPDVWCRQDGPASVILQTSVGRAGRRWWKYNSLMGGVDRMDQLRSYYSVGRAGRRWWKYNSLMGGVDRMDQLRSYYSVGRAGRRWWKYNSLMGGVDRMNQLRSYYSVGRAGRRWWKYNSLMGGVDRMDQLRSYYSVGRAGRRWWKYIFWSMVNIGIINAYILWKKMNHPLPANSRVSSLKTWKMRLIHNMVDDYVPQSQQRCEPAVDNLSVERVFADNIVPGHPLVRNLGRKRTCKQCAHTLSLSKQNMMQNVGLSRTWSIKITCLQIKV